MFAYTVKTKFYLKKDSVRHCTLPCSFKKQLIGYNEALPRNVGREINTAYVERYKRSFFLFEEREGHFEKLS